MCNYRKNDKCPPWTVQSSKMLHDRKKKTIFYDNAVIKVYDIPIFYIPRLSHPDPTVDRRSVFLPPTLYDTKFRWRNIIPIFDLEKIKFYFEKCYILQKSYIFGEYHQLLEILVCLLTRLYRRLQKLHSEKTRDKSHLFLNFLNIRFSWKFKLH